jgi:hypothetical protein
MNYQYIVWSQSGPLLLHRYDNDCPRGGVLVTGDTATVFGSWSSARRAIDRSISYCRANGYGWAQDYRIKALSSNPNGAA